MLHRNYYSKRTCFFFNTVHLVKNRKNFLNSKKLIFPAFEFIDFNFQCSEVYVTLGHLHKIHEFHPNLQSHLKKGSELSYQVLHPGKNKQNFLLPLSIFYKTTVTVSSCSVPDRRYMSVFLEIFYNLWTIANSKQGFNPKQPCNSAVTKDKENRVLQRFNRLNDKMELLACFYFVCRNIFSFFFHVLVSSNVNERTFQKQF